MCGIVGSINFPLTPSLIDKYLGHRGPDDKGTYQHNNLSFYHRRLSILDMAGGAQPMHLDDAYSIIYNGEIFNHQELRETHQLSGKTHSDTETLLMLYRKLGEQMLNELDGMFAFCIYDHQKNEIFIARDRAGEKPLYIYDDGDKLVFASELNCLKALLPLEKDDQVFYHYLRLGVFYRKLTPYINVAELEAGTYLKINLENNRREQKRWWDVHSFYLQKHSHTLDEAIAKSNTLLHQSVKRRILSSDLEVGCFLSGGIDSGLVTSVASEYNNKLKTFTVSFSGVYDEAPLARLVANKYGTDHHEINISFDNLKEDVETIISNYGEPYFDSSAIPSYYVSREARKYLPVILNGDGADELFAGYRRYVPFAKYDFFNRQDILKAVAGMLNNLMPYPKEKKSIYNYVYRLAALASKSNVEVYLAAGVDITEGFENWIVGNQSDYLSPIRNDFKAIAGAPLSGLRKIMNMDFDCNLFSDLLVKMDIATMAHSLEGRSPFLSKEFLEYIPGLNDRYKIRGSQTKFLLRQLAKDYLPPALIDQPKRGFEIPLKSWVNNELSELINDYLSSSSALYHSFFKKDFGSKLLSSRISIPAEKRAKIIWMLFAMEVWYKKVYLQR